MEQKEQKRCIAETALRGHYGGIVRRVLAITRQVREEQCKKQSSRFLHSCLPVCLPEKAFEYRRGVYCDVPCTFCTLALGCSVRCHAHYVEYNEKGGFLLFDLAPVKVFSFSPAQGLHFCIRRLLHTFFSFLFFFFITSPYVNTSVIKVFSIGCKQY